MNAILEKIKTILLNGIMLSVCFGLNAQEVKEVSLEEKIGQMLMVGFKEMEVGDDHFIMQDIKKRHLGGVVLFDVHRPLRGAVVPDDVPIEKRNIRSPKQLRALTAKLQGASEKPLWIAIDQEGGLVARLKPEYGFPVTKTHQALGKMDLDASYEHASSIAKTLKNVGINFNFAPVVDLHYKDNFIANKERCFSPDCQKVCAHAKQYIRAHEAEGVLCLLKHFPGHGNSRGDSHKCMVDMTKTWHKEELVPFKELIETGVAKAIMCGHVICRVRDEVHPASLSEKIITQWLRKELGFGGIVVTDDVQMEAIAANYSFDEAIIQAINAGNDIVLITNTQVYEEEEVAHMVTDKVDLIKAAVEAGKIKRNRVDEAYERIQKLKAKMG